MTDEPKPNLLKFKRTPEEIKRDVEEGRLDIADVKLKEFAIIDEIDMSGDTPKLVRTRKYIEGDPEVEIINYP